MDVSAVCVLTDSPFICMNISPPLVSKINYFKIIGCPCKSVAKTDERSCSIRPIHKAYLFVCIVIISHCLSENRQARSKIFMVNLMCICICSLKIPDAFVGLYRRTCHAGNKDKGAMDARNPDFVLIFALSLYLLEEHLKAQVNWNEIIVIF